MLNQIRKKKILKRLNDFMFGGLKSRTQVLCWPGVCLAESPVYKVCCAVELIRIFNISGSGRTPVSGVKCFTENQIASLQTYHLIDGLQNKIIIFNITAY